ncbi:hypothetical protein CLOM_g9649 [Closterium sp. NIES-68]|nr:hypothetical protein CLOM_g6076 [Closterium sp. NIES-68]GJP50484.1 hypothetical protein CLOM_g9649 [Closterium sp. NIES-68]GJP58491.1 hypothetical protein CLOP_g351 [Closterium sp. NIES-67]GJP79279.1 hypothetical protein CLOP_g9530 [Closterium sp. NIES-67]
MSLSKGEPSVTCLGKIKSHLLQEALSSVQISVEVAPPAAVTDLRTEPPSSEAHCMVRAIEKTGGEEVFHRKTLSESEIFYTRLQSSHEAGDSTNAAAATSPEGSPSSPGSPAPPEADASASSCPGAPIKRRMDDGSRLAAIADVVKFRKAVRELNFGFNFNGLEVLRSSCDVAPIARMATSHEGSHPSPARPHPSPAGSHPAPPGLHDSPPASAAAPEAATTAKVYPPGAPKKRRPGDRLDLAATMSKTKKCRIVSRKLNFDAASSRILLM